MVDSHRILVTGATGLVGNALIPLLLERGWLVRASARNRASAPWLTNPGCEFARHDITAGAGSLCDGVEAVVHLAARVHIMRDTARDPLAESRLVNVTATRNLAEAAAISGVRHFIYLSSIKVNGECSSDQPFTEADMPAPQDAYAISKHEAEQALSDVATRTTLGITILRPPLIYGHGVKGNFAALVQAVLRGVPLPLGAIRNRRSLLYAGNLADAILATLARPAGGVRTYLISDGEDMSTPELIRFIAAAVKREAILWPVPPALLRLGGKLTGRSIAVDRLLGSLRIDNSRFCRDFNWRPPYDVEAAMAASLASAAPGIQSPRP